MDRFGYRQIPFDLNGNNIHCLENVLTLDIGIHSLFDELKLWFEPTVSNWLFDVESRLDWKLQGILDTYKLGAPNSRYILPHYMTTVTFTSRDPEKLPLPSPEYLAIHAACARVAHLSGAGEHIDKVLRELEDNKVLSKDGASAEALEHALLPLSQQIRVFWGCLFTHVPRFILCLWFSYIRDTLWRSNYEPLVYEEVFITITQSSYHCKSKVNRTNLAFDFRTLFVGYGSCWQFIYLCPERCTISMLGQSCMECENV